MHNPETLIMFPEPKPAPPTDAEVLADWTAWAYSDRRWMLAFELARLTQRARRAEETVMARDADEAEQAFRDQLAAARGRAEPDFMTPLSAAAAAAPPTPIFENTRPGRSDGGAFGPQHLDPGDADQIVAAAIEEQAWAEKEAAARAEQLRPIVLPIRPPAAAPGQVTKSARCRYETSPGSECHIALFWNDDPDKGDVGWHHLDGSDRHEPRA